MSKGYICIAQNTGDHDYLSMSYAMALSLKATQKINNVCLCVDADTRSLLTGKHYAVFDDIVNIPWHDDAQYHPSWKIHNKWKYAHMTPYTETIVLDSDVIFTENIDHWWTHLTKKDFLACTNVKTFRGENVTGDYYRKKFTELNLPNVYTNFMYFKQSELTYEITRMTEIIMTNWDVFYEKYLRGIGQNWMSADMAYALAIRILDVEDLTCDYHIKDVPTFVHMKSYIQNINIVKINSDWTKSLTSQLSDDLSVMIGNYRQETPVHYVEKHWMTEDKIAIYEKALGI
jgi:uncharacterized CHY-type Zn-finger protein